MLINIAFVDGEKAESFGGRVNRVSILNPRGRLLWASSGASALRAGGW